jgi:hypothetical protein
VRLLISTFLFPDERLAGSAERLGAIFALLTPTTPPVNPEENP